MKNFYNRTALLLLLFFFLFVAALQAQNLVTYNLSNGSLAPSSIDPNVAATNMNFTGSAASQYPASNFPYLFLTVPAGATNATTAVSSNSYFQFTLTPNSTINLTNLTFGVGGNNFPPSGVQKEGYAVRSSADGYGSNLASGIAPVQFSSLSTITVSLSAAAFQNLSTAVTFRIYGFINTTISVERDPAIVFNDIKINGTVVAPPVPEINLKGNGNPIANNSFSPSTNNDTDFGSSVFGSGAVEKTFTIENLGGSPLNLTGPQQNPVQPLVTLGGSDAAAFSVTALPSTPIAGGTSTTFKISFNPSTAGTKDASVTITNDDADEGSYLFLIRAASCVNNPVVTTTANSGAGSLRDAIDNACAGSTITFDPSVFGSAQTITLTSSDLNIQKNLTITGPGVAQLTVNQTYSFSSVFTIQSGNTVNISGLKITGGASGGVTNYGGTVTLTNCELSSNNGFTAAAYNSSGTMSLIGCTLKNNSSGGIINFGTSVTATNCEISGNSGSSAATYNSSGIMTLTGCTIKDNTSGGIINFGTTLTVTNCQIKDNSKPSSIGAGIYISSGTLHLSGSTISGNSGSDGSGIMNFGTVIASNTRITGNTSTNNGGGVYHSSNSMTLTNCTIANNNAVAGAGIYNFGSLTVTGSTVSNNTSSGNFNGGGISVYGGSLTLTNSTISGNQVTDTDNGTNAGGLWLGADATITSCTVTGNSASASSSAGGVYRLSGTTTFKNTIIAGNTGTNGANPDLYTFNAFTSDGYNLIGDGTGGSGFTGTADQVGTSGSPINAMLGPLADNGGSTFTHKLQSGSPAVDKGNAFGLTTDQRGLARTEDNPVQTNAADGTDIGATERTCVSNTVVTTTANSGAGSLRDAIDNACAGSTITFDPSVFGSAQTITLTSGVLTIDKNLTITGPGAKLLTISGNNADRVFLINANVTATITGVTITGGFSTPVPASSNTKNGGAIFIFGSGQLTLNNCTISNNLTGSAGNGGGICNNGTLTVTNSTISGNTTSGDGGGILNNGPNATLTVTNSTISGNTSTASNGGGINNTGTMSVSNSTITNNSAKAGGGIITFGTMSLKSSIVAGNTAQNTPDLFATSGTGTSQGYNLFGSGTISPAFTTVATDVLTSSPGLGILADNGGPTQTHKLLGGSPAFDNGNAFGLTTDQRGLVRTLDIASQTNASGGDGTDIGAIEVACITPTFTACPTNKTAFTSANACTAVVDYVATADGSPASEITYAFTGLTMGTGNGSGSGSTFNKGVTTVTLTATNDCGAPTCQFTVTVTDNVKPIITCPANRTVNVDQDLCSSVQTYDVTTTDNCSASTNPDIWSEQWRSLPSGCHHQRFHGCGCCG